MAQVSVRVNGRDYLIACEDGDEERLTELADYVNARVGELVASVGQVGEARLLLMAALMVSDELADVYQQLEGQGPGGGGDPLAALADRIERIAETLEKA
jgi:cell division protein ZapA